MTIESWPRRITTGALLASLPAHSSVAASSSSRGTALLIKPTNIGYLRDILTAPAFVAGDTDTNFLARHMADWRSEAGASEEEWIAAAVFEAVGRTTDDRPQTAERGQAVYDPWEAARGWRNVE